MGQTLEGAEPPAQPDPPTPLQDLVPFAMVPDLTLLLLCPHHVPPRYPGTTPFLGGGPTPGAAPPCQ